MNLQELLARLDLLVLNEMTIHKSKCSFQKFYDDAIYRYNYKKQRTQYENTFGKEKAKYKYPELPYENVLNALQYQNILVTNESIEHVVKRHPEIEVADWEEFLNSFNPKQDEQYPTSYSHKNSTKIIYKYEYNGNYFGYVVRYFPKAQAQLVTMFKGNENTIDNWIKNTIKEK